MRHKSYDQSKMFVGPKDGEPPPKTTLLPLRTDAAQHGILFAKKTRRHENCERVSPLLTGIVFIQAQKIAQGTHD